MPWQATPPGSGGGTSHALEQVDISPFQICSSPGPRVHLLVSLSLLLQSSICSLQVPGKDLHLAQMLEALLETLASGHQAAG